MPKKQYRPGRSGAFNMKEGDVIRDDLTGVTGDAGEFTQDGDVTIWGSDGTAYNTKWNHCSLVKKRGAR